MDFFSPVRSQIGNYFNKILYRFGINLVFFSEFYPTNSPDLVLDASGFRLGDQWNHTNKYLNRLENYYAKLKHNGANIILLPQAFGPFKSQIGKRSVKVLNQYCDMVFARETKSRDFLFEAGINPNKVKQCPDFTGGVKGEFPTKYDHYKNGICIIPNGKMLTHTKITEKDYINKYVGLIRKILKKTGNVFLLNHEGKKDYEICEKIGYNCNIPIISKLNALEIKGIIGASNLVISSRFHGVASALHQSVPCFATSWSHKYKCLLSDFGIKEHLIDLEENLETLFKKIESSLDLKYNRELRYKLAENSQLIEFEVSKMWDEVWTLAKNIKSEN